MKFKEFLKVLKKCKPMPKNEWTFESVMWNLHDIAGFNLFG